MQTKTFAQDRSEALQILIVEDEAFVAGAIQERLLSLGYQVAACVPSAEAVVAQTQYLRPDVVLMTTRLGRKIEGIQAAEYIGANFQIPIVYISHFSDLGTTPQENSPRSLAYVLQSVEQGELYEAIETAVQQHLSYHNLKHRERWLNSILRDIGDGVIVADLEGRIQFINPIAQSLTGWQHDEAIGAELDYVFRLIWEDTRAAIDSPTKLILRQGKTIALEENVLLIARNGSEVPIADSLAPLRDVNGTITGVIVVFRDVSQQHLVEERDLAVRRSRQLEQQMEEMQALAQMRDDFLSTVSHELRTPLANMKMAIQMLEIMLQRQGILDPEDDPIKQRTVRYLDILRSQCNHEMNLVNDLLNLQQLRTNAYNLIPSLIHLSEWLPALVEHFYERMRANALRVILNIPALPVLQTDESSLSRILSELLNNACKYTPSGETITISAHLTAPEPESTQPGAPSSPPTSQPISQPRIAIEVTNSGVEVAASEQANIFDQFYRIPGSDFRNQGGTGLGLALCRQLVHHLGGDIYLESHSRQTRFTVELPLRMPKGEANSA